MNITIDSIKNGHEIYKYQIIESKFKFKYWTGEGQKKLFSYTPFYESGEIELQYLEFQISDACTVDEAFNVQAHYTYDIFDWIDDDTMEERKLENVTLKNIDDNKYYQIKFWEIKNEQNLPYSLKIHHPIQIMFRGDKLKEILIPIGNFILQKYKNENLASNEKLENKRFEILSDIDKDGNGQVDAIEGNDFNVLLRKHQKSIIEIDKEYVKKFIKISSYLKDKKANINVVFEAIKFESDELLIIEYSGILKNEINTYHSILANGISMLVALINEDFISYEEIYESLDRINLFDSQWEKDVSQKLTNIGNGLNDLLYEMQESNERIIDELSNLTYATESGFIDLSNCISNELKSIDSSIKFNNLLTGIQTYQMYKINKNTRGLSH